MENDSISIVDILKEMLHKLWLIILFFIVGLVTAFFVSTYILPEKYSSYTTMYVKNNGKSLQEYYLNSSDITAAKSLVSTYTAVLQSDTMMRNVGESLIKDYGEERIAKVFNVSHGKVSESSIKSSLSMSSVNDTEVMKITSTTTDAEISAAVCQTIARLAPDFLIRVVGAGSVETIDEAQINYTVVSPNVIKNSLMGAIMGMVIACIIIFLIYFFDNTVKSSQTLSDKFDKAILGEIYDISESKKKESAVKGDLNGHFLITDPQTPFYVTEAFKQFRTNLIFSISTSDKKIVAISSSMPNEGKSTLASNTAIALAQIENTKVLLIDADMRKPAQHMIFGLKNKIGLSSALGKMNSVGECIQQTNIDNLSIITSGSQPPNPSELLSSSQMETVLNELSQQYDYIIIDMPPINVVSDPLSIGKLIAGIVVVVKYASTTFDDVSEIVKKSELSNTKMLGFVMTRVKRGEAGNKYYSKKYKDSYGYGTSSEQNGGKK